MYTGDTDSPAPGSGVKNAHTSKNPTDDRTVLRCHKCNAPGSVEEPLKYCSQCKKAVYCSVKCQRQDWKKHRTSCERSIKLNKPGALLGMTGVKPGQRLWLKVEPMDGTVSRSKQDTKFLLLAKNAAFSMFEEKNMVDEFDFGSPPVHAGMVEPGDAGQEELRQGFLRLLDEAKSSPSYVGNKPVYIEFVCIRASFDTNDMVTIYPDTLKARDKW